VRGELPQKRRVVNCNQYISSTRNAKCCATTPWVNVDKVCSKDGKMKQQRRVYNCPNEPTERTVKCTYKPCKVYLYENKNQGGVGSGSITSDRPSVESSYYNFKNKIASSYKIVGTNCKVVGYTETGYLGNSAPLWDGPIPDGIVKNDIPTQYEDKLSSISIENK